MWTLSGGTPRGIGSQIQPRKTNQKAEREGAAGAVMAAAVVRILSVQVASTPQEGVVAGKRAALALQGGREGRHRGS